MENILKNNNSPLNFTKYKKAVGETKILLLYLILNNYDLSKVKKVEEKIQEQTFGVTLKKIYGITEEYIDEQRITQELASIRIPVICSPRSFEMYANSDVIYAYKAKNEEKSLYINDAGVISPLMIIAENYVVSTSRAVPLEDTENTGFMYFVEYVLKGKTIINDWEISYQQKEFCIYYNSKDNEERLHKELLYNALELEKSSSYQLVLYVIKKLMKNVEEFVSDNFIEEVWEKKSEK